MANQKQRVAILSVFAAVFITLFKLAIGYATNSLGILSEALHSGLDLLAAMITMFAVHYSDRPADKDHHFGHGKIENMSALIETLLLLITCVWIIYEAIHRLLYHTAHLEVNIWSYVVVITSIVIDYTRSRALYRTAKKYNSQALEADALHFATDIWSSAVVLLGLVCAQLGLYWADSVAALFVAAIVVGVSYQLGRKSVDILLDKSPQSTVRKIEDVLRNIHDITCYHDLRVRVSGAETFVEVNIHLKETMDIKTAHQIAHKVEQEILKVVERCTVHIHEEPED